MTRWIHSLLILLLLLAVSAPALAQDVEDAAPIEPGESVTGELDEDAPSAAFTFDGEEGDSVVITLVSEDFDTYLVLLGSDGEEIAADDDGGPGSLDSQIGPFTLPESGSYTIIADSFSHYFDDTAFESGEFTLDLASVDQRRIEYSQNVSGELTDESPEAFFSFSGREGDIVSLVVSATDFVPYVELEAPDYVLASADGSYSSDGSATISSVTLPVTGNYVVNVRGLDAGSEGEFSLRVSRAQVVEVEVGDTVEATFGPNMPAAYYQFEGAAGDVLDLIVDSPDDIDTTLTVNGPDGYQVAYDDDTNDLNPAIESLVLGQDGTYTAIVQPYASGTRGDITFTLEEGELITLDEGAQSVAFTVDDQQEVLAFTAQAGELVRVNLRLLKGEMMSPTLTVLQGVQNLVYANASSVNGYSVEFLVPSDGLVTVQLEEYSYADLSVQVSLDRLETGPEAGDEESLDETAEEAEEAEATEAAG